jgi:hypothetical protein
MYGDGDSSGPVVPSASLLEVESVAGSAVAQWDAGVLASYDPEGTDLLNIISPTNGDAQSAYDMAVAGVTFVGTVDTGGAYLQKDATSNFITQKLAQASLSSFQKDMMKNSVGDEWTLYLVMSADDVSNNYVFSAMHQDTTYTGLAYRAQTSPIFRSFSYIDGASNAFNISTAPFGPADTFLIAARYRKTSIQMDFAYNEDTFSKTDNMQSNSTKETGPLSFLGNIVLSSTAAENSRFYGGALFTGAHTNAQLAAVRDWYQAHTGETL